MDNKNLKLLAKCYVEAQEDSQEKTEPFFNFIDEAEDHQIINFMITGRPEFATKTGSYDSVMEFQESNLSLILEPDINLLFEMDNVPESIAKIFWYLAKKVEGKKPFISLKNVEIWLNTADQAQVTGTYFALLAGTVGISALALAALTGYVLKKIAKRTLSKAAKACRGKSGKDKTLCMKKYEIEVVKLQMKVLQKALAACNKSKNPGACKAKMSTNVEKLKKKIEKLKTRG